MIPALAAAADATNPLDAVWSQILGLGAVGSVLLLILFKQLVPGWAVSRQDTAHQAELDARETAHQREIAAKDALIAQQDSEITALRSGLDTSSAFLRDQVVPALTRSTDALVRSNDLAREHLAELTRRAAQP
ncbi:hypothetical protein I6A62_03070 [Frankia sp. AgW1.1]|nr:hypothetical protein [Frankia sp. AgW1.1]